MSSYGCLSVFTSSKKQLFGGHFVLRRSKNFTYYIVLVSWKWLRSQVTLRRREGGKGGGLGAEEDTRNIFAHHRNSEGQMFESFKTPETWICYSGQWQQGLSEGAPGMSRAITPPFCPSISHLHIAYT